MASLCSFVNSLPEFFSSSSCAGRIMLLKVDESESKKEAAFLARWHRKITPSEAWGELQRKAGAPEVWLKQEPFILHLGTNSLENANRILECMKLAGIKRGGIMLARPEKFLLEIVGTQNISLPVKKGNRIIVDRKFFDFVVKRANKKLLANYAALKRFERVLRERLRNG
jgi:tRNA wybutosine-synthesizing protein 3